MSSLERNDWDRFGENPALNPVPVLVPVPAARVRSKSPVNLVEPIDTSGPDHNSLGYALPLPKRPSEETQRKTPPPVPRPFSRRNIIADSKSSVLAILRLRYGFVFGGRGRRGRE